MSEQNFQEKLQQLRNVVKEAKEMEKRARAELERNRAVLIDKKTKYLRLKLQNDQLDIELDLKCRLRAKESARGAYHWDKIEKELDEKMNRMGGALRELDAEKQDESDSIMTFFRSVKDIPKNFTDEVLSQKLVEIERKRKETIKSIEEHEKKKEEVKAEMEAEAAMKQERNDTLDAFSKDVKTAIVQVEAELRRRKAKK
ncbi:stress response protein NST1-like [Bradysia coprophila]|uniref:stress response protein NST1-like n=1 Tax=Bradysia coprophila TaxID=38358 RepID=UPI00187D811E|nr:stress response protein NST1-like [Bradysia coprophila]